MSASTHNRRRAPRHGSRGARRHRSIARAAHPIRLVALIASVGTHTARSTPLYAAREGRTCDNCHVSPNRWQNPEVAGRKCSMSCRTCHVDPSGDGMRTAAGRFFGRGTLAMIAISPRPTNDWDRNVPGLGRHDRATSYSANIPQGPPTLEAARAYADSIHDPFAWGSPPGETPYGPYPGRYASLRADPVLRVGADMRFAFLRSKANLAFPMQFDVGTVLHPVHHATLLANVGVRGRPSGYSATIDDSHTPYFRELFAMTHEWSYQAYVKAGRFVPAFGLRLDDHTVGTRSQFELDTSLPESRVTGIEVGASPNYPFAQASWFKMTNKYRVPDAWNIFDVDRGWGAALNLGYRDVGWNAGASVLARRRPLDEGGDADTYGVYGGFNPWAYRRRLPLTLLGEADYGTYQRQSGNRASKLAYYGELDLDAWNGVDFLAAYDFFDPDRDVASDAYGRYQLGLQVTPFPGVTLDGRVRMLRSPIATGDGHDVFLQVHVWF